ncbi:MAG: carboxypeptidase regulatory-like domain-containing protein, partial [Myxococcaceae bacterium]|nr:carboxypeptidase regulatory-like domain-containing protein [Myxococcaceae bacterium]
MPRLALVLLVAGCFPYRELYRPDVSGRVVDEGGAAVAGARVTSCSYTRWARPKLECPRSAEAVTDADGGFTLPALEEWEWCCFGEAPLPITELYTSGADGGA